MKSILITLGALALGALASPAGPIGAEKRSTSKSWAGTNLYFLQGLSDADQNTYINNLASYGAKVVRVWVNAQPGGNTCEKGSYIAKSIPALEDTIGQYNAATLDALDSVLVKLAAKGIKALISPHDANMICGSNG
jgi:mannan endo-1,4-beta-mannosidase